MNDNDADAARGAGRRPAVFLDRDGVISRNIVRGGRGYAPTSLAEFEILPGTAEAVAAFRAAGYLVIVATNQPDVGAGRVRREIVEAMHARLRADVAVDDIMVCYHTEADACACRKPKPGMLLAAAERHRVDLARSFMVGDRWGDVEAGRAAGCRTLFIEYGFDERRPERPDRIVRSLPEAVPFICGE
jgi:D-glycero-D-manno-heptose 1,7-bisphosphate phosphatase